MADGLRITPIHVHQAIHGYDDGHRLLVSSIPLKGRDANTLLVMSDVSGPNAQIANRGYLTGYPLPESGFYALACTWPAPEMSRPGCVWTHTLLVDFADLGTLDHPAALIDEFRRPSLPINRSTYARPLKFKPGAQRWSKPLDREFERPILGSILNGLYEQPEKKVLIVVDPGFEAERWVLAIWEQQWPRLRRSFRFCTLAYADRSFQGASFDLQVLPPEERSQRAWAKVAGSLVDARADAPGHGASGWIEVALDDLAPEGPKALREFLRQSAVDISSTRRAFVPLCEVHRLLRDLSANSEVFRQVIEVIEGRLAVDEGKVVRGAVVERIIERADKIELLPLAFVLRNLHLVKPSFLEKRATSLGQALWSHERDTFWRLLDTDGPARKIAERAAEVLPAEELIAESLRTPQILTRLLQVRPALLAHRAVWSASEEVVDVAMNTVTSQPWVPNEVIDAMIESGTRGLASRAVRVIDRSVVLMEVSAHLDRSRSETLSASEVQWVAAAVEDRDIVAAHLPSGAVRAKTTLLAFARATHPDAIPNDVGEDPWLTASRGATGTLSRGGQLYFAAYILARGLGNRSRNAAELIAIAFDDVYSAAAESSLPADTWRLVEPRLPWSIGWFDWDRCQRLRSAVVDAFVKKDLAVEIYARITADDRVFKQLTDTMSRSSRGRTYLNLVRQALERRGDEATARRCHIVDEAL